MKARQPDEDLPVATVLEVLPVQQAGGKLIKQDVTVLVDIET